MSKAHGGHGLGEVRRLLWVEGRGSLDGPHGAKSTASGALLAGDHEGGVTAGPAFVDVWAPGFLTHRVQHVVLHRRFGGVERRLLGTAGQAGAEPIWKPPFGSRFGVGGGHGELFTGHGGPLADSPVGGSQKGVWALMLAR